MWHPRKPPLLVAFVSLAFILNRHVSSGFAVRGSVARELGRTVLFMTSDKPIKNGKSKPMADNEADKPTKSSKKKQRNRSADYPSFSYDLRKKSPKEKDVYMKYSCDGSLEKRKFRKPRLVSIPQPEKNSMSLLDQLLLTLTFGAESGLGNIAQSALRTRLVKGRSYAATKAYDLENMMVPPALSDLSYPQTPVIKGFWVSVPARLLTLGFGYLAFPFIVQFANQFVTMKPEQLDEITSKFGPGISILYGTFISLTLSILYDRVKTIQNSAARECSLLTLMTRNLLSLFHDDREAAIDAVQCAADQVRTLVRSSRGAELMLVMYSDPYARMQVFVEQREMLLFEQHGSFRGQDMLLGSCRDTIKELHIRRAERLSVEALSLPPTHFLILNLLTFLIILSFIISVLPALDKTGGIPQESSILFAILTNVYILFYYFATDLNDPFDGVYQIRRSSSACHLLEAKWLIANHPLLGGEVDFEEVAEGPDGVSICTPGLGKMYFENDDIYVDGDNRATGDLVD